MLARSVAPGKELLGVLGCTQGGCRSWMGRPPSPGTPSSCPAAQDRGSPGLAPRGGQQGPPPSHSSPVYPAHFLSLLRYRASRPPSQARRSRAGIFTRRLAAAHCCSSGGAPGDERGAEAAGCLCPASPSTCPTPGPALLLLPPPRGHRSCSQQRDVLLPHRLQGAGRRQPLRQPGTGAGGLCPSHGGKKPGKKNSSSVRRYFPTEAAQRAAIGINIINYVIYSKT